jgi:2-polyprenyl-3-methyl-5-hydroxy-6-metoxy-1,4-benzoquinol methylase
MIEIDKIADNLVPGEDGIWESRNRSSISYPEAGNAACCAVEDGSFWFKHRNRCIVEVMRIRPPAGALFDIGGGNGFVASALIEAGMETVLVEPGKTGVVNAKTRGVSNIIQSTLQDAGFREGTIPAAGLFDVLEHIEDDVSFLKTLSGLLIQGGRLYLTVPAHQVLWSVVDEHAGHYRRYTVKSLSKVLSHAGFDVEFAFISLY